MPWITFIQEHTAGYEELRRPGGNVVGRDPERERRQPGQISEAAEIIRKSKSMIICWAMGLTQHKNAVANIRRW